MEKLCKLFVQKTKRIQVKLTERIIPKFCQFIKVPPNYSTLNCLSSRINGIALEDSIPFPTLIISPVNIFIHVLFVWPIFFTTSFYTIPKSPCGFDHGLALNFGFLFTLIYAASYVAFDKKSGSNAALLCLICWVGASILDFRLGYSQTWKIVLAAQLFCWTNQFIGHGVFEKRAPALLDNPAQPFLMAPFFVFFEVLQSLFKYEPYPGFSASVQAKIKADIKEWKEQKEKLT